jgi:hypothetical protein
MDLRPHVSPVTNPANNTAFVGNGNGNYLTFDIHPELSSGRRRAETVTGATSVVVEASLRAHHPHIHVHSRVHPPNSTHFVPAQHARPDSGQVLTTRRRRDNGTVGAGGFRLPVEDHDMVLG